MTSSSRDSEPDRRLARARHGHSAGRTVNQRPRETRGRLGIRPAATVRTLRTRSEECLQQRRRKRFLPLFLPGIGSKMIRRRSNSPHESADLSLRRIKELLVEWAMRKCQGKATQKPSIRPDLGQEEPVGLLTPRVEKQVGGEPQRDRTWSTRRDLSLNRRGRIWGCVCGCSRQFGSGIEVKSQVMLARPAPARPLTGGRSATQKR